MSDPPIPAATLILVRDRPSGEPELLMVERAAGMAFAGGALVFPGGRIDASDAELAAAACFPEGPAGVAAIRETVEETAIPVGIQPLPAEDVATALQKELAADHPFGELLETYGLKLGADTLTPFARWVPQFHAVRRFDTMFFIAEAPPGAWVPRVIERECAGAHWISAQEVLRREQAGTAKLIFPTRRTLERLALHGSFAALRADAEKHPIEPITPWVEDHDGERFITIPDYLGYPVTREKLDGLWRG